jgi:hypothetical protein
LVYVILIAMLDFMIWGCSEAACGDLGSIGFETWLEWLNNWINNWTVLYDVVCERPQNRSTTCACWTTYWLRWIWIEFFDFLLFLVHIEGLKRHITMIDVHTLTWFDHFSAILVVLEVFSCRFSLRTIGILVCLSTIYDIYSRRFGFKRRELFLAFSLPCNFRQLLVIKKSNSVIKCIDGLKALSGLRQTQAKIDIQCTLLLSVCWVIFFHSSIQTKRNSTLARIYHTVRTGGEYPVDTFFTLSGILVCMSLCQGFTR